MIGVEYAACLRPLVSDLRHYQPMGNGKSDGKNLWLRTSEWLRVSAWLPPGLALAWLATLATLVHNVDIVLADWAATVSLVVLVVLVVQRRHAPPRTGSPTTTTGQTVPTGTVATASGSSSGAPFASPTTAQSADKGEGTPTSATNPATAMDTAAVPASRNSDLASEPKPHPPIAGLITSELRTLTAEEAASVLRVDTGLVITSISNGELPGNRIGSQWRIDLGALVRWLQGPYGNLADKDPNR